VKPYAQVARDFGQALVDGDYEAAYGLLSPHLQQSWTPQALERELFAMFSGYAPESVPEELHFEEEDPFVMTQWPDRQPDDLGWAYVGIHGEGFVEAVTVIVAQVDGRALIRHLEWGRP
jgi:hypothetical protein